MDILSAFEIFPTKADCIAHLEFVRWRDLPKCPYCRSTKTTPLPKEQRHHCNNCNTSFSATVGTIFHKTRLPLQKWFVAVVLTLDTKEVLSARQLARVIKVNKDTAWRMATKIRNAMAENEQRSLLTGLVSAKETFVGRPPRKRRPGGKTKSKRGTEEALEVGIVERGGRAKFDAIERKGLSTKRVVALVHRLFHIENATLTRDGRSGRIGKKRFVPHETVNHQVRCANSCETTKTFERYWATLKRGIIAEHHEMRRRSQHSCMNEFKYGCNHRDLDDLFDLTIARAVGAKNV